MKIYLCQVRSTNSKVPVIPYAQLALAAHIEDIAEVEMSGYAPDGTHPPADFILEKIKAFQPDVVGITIEYAAAFKASLALVQRIKEYNPGITVISGGHHATFTADELLETGYFDAIFLGEGETSLREYVIKKDFHQIPGVVFLEDGKIINNGPCLLLPGDKIKSPAYHLLAKGLKPLMGIESSRGCPFNCDFCETRNFFGSGRLRKKSPVNFIENFKKVVEVTGGGNFVMVDDCFTADMKEHVKPICEMLIAEDFPISIFFQGRVADLLKNLELIPLLAKAKISSVCLGIEAIYQETLDLMNKKSRYGKDSIRRLVETCIDNGMAVFASIVFGYPNETPEMILNTADYLISLDVTTASMTIATPIPGSPLYEREKKNNNLLTRDYDLYDGMNRVSKTIPETTPIATALARRKFYIRPEYIRKTFNNALDPSKADMRTFMPGGLLCHNIWMPNQARPNTIEDWITLIQGLNLVLKDHLTGRKSIYSSRVKFQLEPFKLIFLIKDGIPVEIHDRDENVDLTIETPIETFTDLLVWAPIDIMSAFLLGKVKSPQTPLNRLVDFILWFTTAQEVLRWAATMKINVPNVRKSMQKTFAADSQLKKKYTGYIENEDALFIGVKGTGGFFIEFSKDKSVENISLVKQIPGNTPLEILISSGELEEILKGGIERLYKALNEKEIVELAAEANEFQYPAEFFSIIPERFRPVKSADVSLAIQFCIETGKDRVEKWWAVIKDKKLSIGQGTAPGASDAAVTMKIDSFRKLINGKIGPIQLLNEGSMTLNGLPQTMIRFAGCFENLFGR
jgi:anaerobic magnesium-protoporphyrin IX monomethyl ester cyclase